MSIETLSISSWNRFIASMVLITAFLPIWSANLPEYVRSHYIWAIIWVISLFYFNMLYFYKTLKFIILYGIVIIAFLLNTLWENIDPWMVSQITYEYYQVAIGVSIISYFLAMKDFEGLEKLVKISFYCVFITVVLSIITALINPMFARDIVGVSDIGSESLRDEILSFKKYGGGGYGFFSSIIGLIPLIFYLVKNPEHSPWKRPTLLIFLLLIIFCTIQVQIFANILIMSITLIFSIAGAKNIRITTVAVIGFVALYLVTPLSFIVDVFQYSATFFDPGSQNYYKFVDFSNYLIYGDSMVGAASGRAARFPLLLESFLSNPLYGGEDWNGHMHWMNKLAVFGLLGTVPFLMLIILYFKEILKYLSSEYKFYFFLASFALLGLGFLKALVGREVWYMFFVIIPGVYFLHKNKNY